VWFVERDLSFRRSARAAADGAARWPTCGKTADQRVDRLPRMTQRTLVLLKPDAVRRGLVGAIVSRYEAKGLSIVAMDQRHITPEHADRHYAEHVDKDFYPPLRAFVTSGPLFALVLEGDEAVDVVRALTGATDGRKAAPGTIRGDLSLSNRENLVHASDSLESAAREIALWFPDLS
jgi:nucleoside-diphosphate kinase